MLAVSLQAFTSHCVYIAGLTPFYLFHVSLMRQDFMAVNNHVDTRVYIQVARSSIYPSS
jgi:hypothetical protein